MRQFCIVSGKRGDWINSNNSTHAEALCGTLKTSAFFLAEVRGGGEGGSSAACGFVKEGFSSRVVDSKHTYEDSQPLRVGLELDYELSKPTINSSSSIHKGSVI